MPAAPPLTVVVIPQVAGARLEAALTSVWEQRWLAPELVVVDHGSDEPTRRWLEERRDRFAALVSAPGANHAAALNAGLAAAHGDWVFELGARDRLVGDMVLSETLNWMKRTEAGVVAGETADDHGRLRKLRAHVNPLARNFTPPSATFYRRTLFDENGTFDASLGPMAVYEFNVRLWKARVRFKPIPLRIAAVDGTREDESAGWPAAAEEIRVRHRYFPAWRCWWWDALSLGRGARRSVGRAVFGVRR
jgi:glycosyltransferase involved in cell wall biosynthesis